MFLHSFERVLYFWEGPDRRKKPGREASRENSLAHPPGDRPWPRLLPLPQSYPFGGEIQVSQAAAASAESSVLCQLSLAASDPASRSPPHPGDDVSTLCSITPGWRNQISSTGRDLRKEHSLDSELQPASLRVLLPIADGPVHSHIR
ncbi:hypothetical protein VULLAG_LOCUS16401 [Vulpes lagopus]